MSEEQYTAQLSLSLPTNLYQEIKTSADKKGVAVNQYIIYVLACHAWDSEGEGSIQLAAPTVEQRQQFRAFFKDRPRLTDEERQRILAERQAERKMEKQPEQMTEIISR